MKLYKYLLILSLVVFNATILSYLLTTHHNNLAIVSSLQTIPDNVIYITNATTGSPDSDKFINNKSDFNASTNYEKIDQINSLPEVISTEMIDIIPSDTISIENKVEDHQLRSTLEINQQSIRADQFDDLQLIAGQLPTKPDQLLVSSAIVDHYGLSSEDVIGQIRNGFSIVGVYQDDSPFQIINDSSSPLIVNPNYSLPSSTDQGFTFSTSADQMHPVQYIKITFDGDDPKVNNELLTNLTINDGISNLTNPDAITSNESMTYLLVSSTLLIDIIAALLLIKKGN